MLEASSTRRCRAILFARPNCAGRVIADRLPNQFRAALNGRRLEENRDREVDPVGLLDLRKEANRNQRMSA